MIPVSPPVVTVVVDGVPVVSATPAVLVGGVVVAPAETYLRDVAVRTTLDVLRLRLTFERDAKTYSLAITADGVAGGGDPPIALAPAARALGALVEFDAPSRTLEIYLPPPAPLTTLVPPSPGASPPPPVATFSPQPVTTPRPQITGIPVPRRTPVPVVDPPPARGASAARFVPSKRA